MAVDWNDDDNVETLKKLWAEGLSCSEIKAQIPGSTRSAIIGKVHRLGLPGRERPSRPMTTRVPIEEREPKQRKARSNPSSRQARPDLAPDQQPAIQETPRAPEVPGLATVATLGAHMCKWPIGEPGTDDFTLCGRRRNDGPYCVEHARIAFQPVVHNGKRRPTGNELARSLRRYI